MQMGGRGSVVVFLECDALGDFVHGGVKLRILVRGKVKEVGPGLVPDFQEVLEALGDEEPAFVAVALE